MCVSARRCVRAACVRACVSMRVRCVNARARACNCVRVCVSANEKRRSQESRGKKRRENSESFQAPMTLSPPSLLVCRQAAQRKHKRTPVTPFKHSLGSV